MRWGIIGTGGHSKVVLEALASSGPVSSVIFFTKSLPAGDFFNSYTVTADEDHTFQSYHSEIDKWHAAIGDIWTRERKLNELVKLKFDVPAIIHDQSFFSPSASLGHGSFINAGAVINADARIGKGCIINTSASVDHDCRIGDFVNIGPGSHLAGQVTIGSHTDIGTGVSIIPQVTIGKGCIIGAGAVVVRDIPEYSLVYGVPAQVIKNLRENES
jgi:sugar O-acyltransferase (sialic acid O-acetyltransferase NeuD family)